MAAQEYSDLFTDITPDFVLSGTEFESFLEVSGETTLKTNLSSTQTVVQSAGTTFTATAFLRALEVT